MVYRTSSKSSVSSPFLSKKLNTACQLSKISPFFFARSWKDSHRRWLSVFSKTPH